MSSKSVPKKQRHTAQRIYERRRDEYGFDGESTIVKDYVMEHRRQIKEMFVPLSHPHLHSQWVRRKLKAEIKDKMLDELKHSMAE